MLTKMLTRAAATFVVGLLVMLGAQYLHHDVNSIPALGYWASYFSSAALVALGVCINGRDEE